MRGIRQLGGRCTGALADGRTTGHLVLGAKTPGHQEAPGRLRVSCSDTRLRGKAPSLTAS